MMLNRLIANIGERLSHKPFEGVSWWWGLKWGDFIEISPQLSEEHALWQHEDSHLKNLRLCGLPPDRLQADIATYWEKPFWKRWFLRFFTDINNKIVIWSYYKRCLSFRMICKETPVLEQRLMVYAPEQRLVNRLINTLKQDMRVLERYLEKYAGNAQWMKKNLDLLLAEYEKKRRKFFVKLLHQYLKKLSTGYDQVSVRKRLEDEYHEMEKMLRNYIKHSCQENRIQAESSLPREENLNQDLVYVGSAVEAPKLEEPYLESDERCSINSINEWLTRQRQTLQEMLREEPPSYHVIQALLKESLNTLQLLVDLQFKNYEHIINEVRDRRIHYKAALDQSECLQHRLTYFFRNGSLLFHPDKSYGDAHLKLIQTELFKAFQPIVESSFEKLSTGLKRLKRLKRRIPKWKLNLDKLLEETEHDRKQFKEWMDQRFAKLEAENAKMRAENAKMKAESAEMRVENAEIRAESAEIRKNQAQMKREISAMETQISTLTQQMGVHTFFSEIKEQGQTLHYSLPQP